MPSRPGGPRDGEGDHVPVRIRSLGSEDAGEEVLDDLTPGERLRLVHELSARMWELTGRPLPSYDRSEMPVRVVRRP